jgi:beta-lactamase class A
MKGTVLAMVGCVVGSALPASGIEAAPRSGTMPQPRSAIPSTPARPYVPTQAEQAARRALDSRVQQLGQAFRGHAGIAVRDLQTGWTSSYKGTSYFPQQSVSKFWVALTALEKVDHRQLSLDAPVVVRKSDLTVFHQPIAALIKGDGYRTTLSSLLHRAITESDNTANDFILNRAGGPEAVRSFLRRHGIEGVRFGPGERLLQSQTAGLSWKQEYSIGNAFYTARANLPMERRRTAFDRYVANPMDGATPIGIVEGLAKLEQGDLLSPESTRRLLSIMSNTKTGPQRLKGALAPGWRLAHKTGTGQNLGGTTAGYNDIGIATAPDGRSYAVAVLIGRTSAGIPERQTMMKNVMRAVAQYHDQTRSGPWAGQNGARAR